MIIKNKQLQDTDIPPILLEILPCLEWESLASGHQQPLNPPSNLLHWMGHSEALRSRFAIYGPMVVCLSILTAIVGC